MQNKLNFEDTKLKRPITREDLLTFIEDYLENHLTQLGEEMLKDAIIAQFDNKEAVKIANDKQYSLDTIERELKHTTEKLILAGMYLSFPLFAK